MFPREGLIKIIEGVISWCVILLPFSIAIAPAPMNVFIGFSIAAFLFKKFLKKERFFRADPVSMPLLFFLPSPACPRLTPQAFTIRLKAGYSGWPSISLFFISLKMR